MKNTIALAVLLIPVFSYAAEFSKVQPEQSGISFVSKQMNVPVEGVFKRHAATIRINPAKPEKGTARIEIDLASIDAGSTEANDEVKGKNWFNVTEFPKAEFVSSSLKSLGSGQFEANGKLTIKGKTKDVKAPFTAKEEKGMLNIIGSFNIKRLDFDLGSGLWGDTSVVSDVVQVNFHFLLK